MPVQKLHNAEGGREGDMVKCLGDRGGRVEPMSYSLTFSDISLVLFLETNDMVNILQQSQHVFLNSNMVSKILNGNL